MEFNNSNTNLVIDIINSLEIEYFVIKYSFINYMVISYTFNDHIVNYTIG